MLHRPEKKEKNTKQNYGGLAIYFRFNLADGVSQMKVDSNDIMWIKLCKEFSLLKEMCIYVCVVLYERTLQDKI